MQGLIRQGDVLLIPTDRIPANTTPVPRDAGRVILAYGEATGHAHAIDHDDAQLVTTEQAGELRMWLQVTAAEPVALVHDEHDTLMVPPGLYERRIQREYTPEGLRNVSD